MKGMCMKYFIFHSLIDCMHDSSHEEPINQCEIDNGTPIKSDPKSDDELHMMEVNLN
jgi:hypothetical protein